MTDQGLSKATSETDLGKLSYASYLNDEDATKIGQGLTDPYDLIETNKDYKVFRDPKNNKIAISFKGSGSDLNDWTANALTLFHAGHYSSQYKNGLKTVKALVEKYGRDNVECVGHSKGASQCSQISKDTGVKATTFAKPKQIGFTKNAKNEKSVIAITDPVGFVPLIPGLPVKAKRIGHKNINPHSAKNYI